MRALVASLHLGLGLALGACGSGDGVPDDPCHPEPTSYVLEAALQVSFPESHDVELAWSDGHGEPVGSTGVTFAIPTLRRAFASAAEARASDGPFTVRIDGVSVGELTVLAAECDATAARAGVAPEELHLVHAGFSVQNVGSAGAPRYLFTSYTQPLCGRSPRGYDGAIDRCFRDRRFVGLQITTTDAIAAYVGEAYHPADALALRDDALVYRFEIELPVDAPVGSVGAEVTFADEGEFAGVVSADLRRCLQLFADPSMDPESLHAEELVLTLSQSGVITVDESFGMACGYADGSYVRGEP